MNKVVECASDEFSLLKRLDNGEYINLTEQDFSCSKHMTYINNERYTPDVDGEYILVFEPLSLPTSFYVSLDSLEQIIQYAPSVRKLKRTSIADLVIAKLMQENTSLHYSVEYDDKDTSKNKIRMYMKILRDRNTRKDIEYVTVFEEAYAEDI